MKRFDWPERGDLVVVKIKRISDYGATVELQEYPGKEAFVHISQVSSGWVKNIRSFVSEGQVRVGKIKYLDREKNTIDVSFRIVSSQKEKRKNEDWRREKRADKLFEMICKEMKQEFKESYKEIAYVLEDEFGDLFSAFENASIYGEEAIEKVDIPAKWKKVIVKHSKESITAQEVSIKGNLVLTSNAGDGILLIRKALKKALKFDGVNTEYVSAPKYRIKVNAIDYNTAEDVLEKATQAVIKEIEKSGGAGSFERIKS